MDGAREKFIQYIDSFLEDVNSSEPTSPYDALEKALKIDKEWVGFLLPSIPELIFSVIGSETKKHNNLTRLWNLGAGDHPSTLDGIVSCHALSPMGDTINFLADLGRNARISVTLGKEFHIMLADRDWTRLNWVVQDYGEHNLTRSEDWRKSVYKSIGGQVHVSNLDNSGHTKRRVIESLASSYTELSRALFGKDNIGKRIENEKAKELVSGFTFSTKTEPSICLLKNDIVDKNIGKEFRVIKQLMDNLKRVDESTFTYYFAQRYHQYRYNNYLKLAVRSERNFDIPFFEIDSSEDKDKLGITKAIYFKDYILGLNGETNEEEFVIPYYFPSGSLYQDSNKLDEYLLKVIMLDDYEDEQKFVRIFDRMRYPHNARLASDYLSFIHMYLSNNKGDLRVFRSNIRKIIKEYSPELADSWGTYTKSNKDFSKSVMIWRDYVFSKWPSKLKLPYYFYPYILLSDDGPHNEFGMMLFKLFNLTVKNIGHPVWYKQ
ncbi:MAG: hypothetical protein JAZ17_23980 [Candidatus Thiodiazotropha endolucinida]|nr:hypothetical protein [Candidatus Thiodiazotropha endolucinida]